MKCRKDLDSKLAALQSESGARGRRFWRSLEELGESEAFRRLVADEFPAQASIWPDSISRRKFLALMGASLALGGLAGCSIRPAPSRDIVPRVKAPEEQVPGKPLFYATAMTLGGDAVGLLVESHDGRPTKIEGNPDHPASLGATSALHQASILTLYDPDRSQTVKYLGHEHTWENASSAIQSAMQMQRDEQGQGLRILTESVVSPTLADQIARLLKMLPEAKWHSYAPINRAEAYRGAEMAFGKRVTPDYEFQDADVVLSLDADFLTAGSGHLRYAREFTDRRRVRTTAAGAASAQMNRLYVVETAVTCTGAKADHRLAVRGEMIEQIARALASELGESVEHAAGGEHAKWIAAVARDLQAHKGRSLVIAGDRQPAVVHLLAHLMNDRLGNSGKTVKYRAPIESGGPASDSSLQELTESMQRDEVRLLLILGGNPAFTAPADIPFVKALERVPLRVHLGLYEDETSRACHWHLPEAHYLETWSDARGHDGTASIIQPLIEPLYQGRSAHEVLSLAIDARQVPGRDTVLDYWRKNRPEEGSQGFKEWWLTVLHDGVIPGTEFEPQSVRFAEDWRKDLKTDGNKTSPAGPRETFELVYLPDPTIYDGRFANNGWLQELPKPITQMTWGNAAIMSPQTAAALKLPAPTFAHGGDHGGYHVPTVRLRLGERELEAPAWVMPGHAEGTITVYLGNGREQSGRVGGTAEQPVGFNLYLLRTSGQPWFAVGLSVERTGRTEVLACTQAHHQMEGRDPVRAATLAQYQKDSRFAGEAQERERRQTGPAADEPLNFYEPVDYSPPTHKWGMSIDVSACVGCNACIVACQAENNVPVVGKEQVVFGREMHWLRVDRYIEGPPEDPEAFYFQPLPCMHCENAPCEYVCPVAATVHSSEGLNEMVYNRCVGTRFCSNNCPYKVRRFNFLAYADFRTESLRLQYNPDVTVRSRGVMEKCTYCVQRIRHAEIEAQIEERPIADGEVLTACQAVCPAQAIVFGDINDEQSLVKKWKDTPLNYSLLEEANTFPRTTYLAALKNPNPELQNPSSELGKGDQA